MTVNALLNNPTASPFSEGDWHDLNFVYPILALPSYETTKQSMIQSLEEEGLSLDEVAREAGKLFGNAEITPIVINTNDPGYQNVFLDDLNGWDESE